MQRRAGELRSHCRDVCFGAAPREVDLGLVEVDLGRACDLMMLRDVGRDPETELSPAFANVGSHRRLGNVCVALFDDTLPQSPGGVALLSRCLAVGLEDLVDECLDGRGQLR